MKYLSYNAIGLDLKVEDKRNDAYYNSIVYKGNLKVEIEHVVAETPLGNINLEKQIMDVPLNEEENKILQELFTKVAKRISKENNITISRQGIRT